MDNATRLREILIAETRSLLARGVIDRRPLDGLKGGNGYSSVAQDLGALVEVLRDRTDDVSAKAMSLVTEAAAASDAINAAIVKRDDQESALTTASDDDSARSPCSFAPTTKHAAPTLSSAGTRTTGMPGDSPFINN